MSLFGREVAGRRHIDGLDVLRTLAIVGVTLFHMFPERLPGGYLGVSLFFVLTGFLLAYTSKRSWLEHRFRVTAYYWKRIKRIYPSLFIVLLTTIGIYQFVLPKAVAAIRPEFLSVILGYNNWWQIAQNADYFTRLTNASPFTHLWFMGIEMQYYLVWPLLFALYAFLDILVGRRAGLFVLAVLALGTDGPIAGYEKYEVQTRALLEYLGPDRNIFWVNVYCPELSWQQTNNDYLANMVKDHPNVTIVDWYGLISQHTDWLGGDGIHPNDEGTAAYAKLIHDTMEKTLAAKQSAAADGKAS